MWLQELKQTYLQDVVVQDYFVKLQQDPSSIPSFSMKHGVLFRKDRIYIPNSPKFKAKILDYIHANPHAGHSSFHKSLHRAKSDFYWSRLKHDLKQFVRICEVCQRNKLPNTFPASLLQTLPVPTTTWTDLSMDFVEGLPISNGHSVIMVVVDRFPKYSHFITLKHLFTAITVALTFFDNVFKLHGMPAIIVTDRGSTFVSNFWKELFHLQGVSLAYFPAYHPQSDGQTKIVNKCLEQFLICFSRDKPQQWSKWLTLAEW